MVWPVKTHPAQSTGPEGKKNSGDGENFSLDFSFYRTSKTVRNKSESGAITSDDLNPLGRLREHWPEYLMEASELGFYMLLCVYLRPCYSIQLHPYDTSSVTSPFVERFLGWRWAVP